MAWKNNTPPQYKIDGEPVYIAADDDAWAMARIEAEAEEAEDRDVFIEESPVHQYFRGETRFRLTAEAAAYLDETKKPTRVCLRRPPADVFIRIDALMRQHYVDNDGAAYSEAMIEAVRHGVKKIDGVSWVSRHSDGSLSDSTISQLYQLRGSHFINELGMAIWIAFQPLRANEEKR